ncbi:hypothetical protein MKZ38_002683 [Zalerion maritima]|uniref:Uncharacterized protein n=1 Tax=Zalerion maritima TaxID=339359 RepID=A0AAD5RPY5_9PEZI|nr:hypothetical protein MKZ38_002683 [Zalerion maritima]
MADTPPEDEGWGAAPPTRNPAPQSFPANRVLLPQESPSHGAPTDNLPPAGGNNWGANDNSGRFTGTNTDNNRGWGGKTSPTIPAARATPQQMTTRRLPWARSENQ